MAGQLGPEFLENVVGRAQVLEVFQAGKTGKAAGARVIEGTIKRNLRARVMRDDVVIYVANVSSLRRFKEDVNEVRSGARVRYRLGEQHRHQAGRHHRDVRDRGA